MRCRFFRRVNKRRRRRGWRPPSGHPPLDPGGGWGGGGGAGEGAEPGEGGGGGEDRGGGWHPGCHADVTQSSEFFDTFWWEYQSILMKKKWSQWLCFCSPCWCLSWWQLKPRACGNPSWPMLPPGLNLQVRLLRFIHTHHYRDVKEEEKRKTHITAWLLMTLYAFFIRYHRTSCIFSSLRFSCRAASPLSTWRPSRGRSGNSSRFHTFQTIHDMSIEHPKKTWLFRRSSSSYKTSCFSTSLVLGMFIIIADILIIWLEFLLKSNKIIILIISGALKHPLMFPGLIGGKSPPREGSPRSAKISKHDSKGIISFSFISFPVFSSSSFSWFPAPAPIKISKSHPARDWPSQLISSGCPWVFTCASC